MKQIVTVNYELKTTDSNGVVENQESTAGEPLVFCSQMNLVLPALEEKLIQLKDGEHFDFVIQKENAFGDRNEALVYNLPRENFMTGGKIDENNIFVGNTIHMQDTQGHHFNALITKMEEATITVDLNHPLAGKDLHFTGTLLDIHEASEAEAKEFEPHHHCGGHCHHHEHGDEEHCCRHGHEDEEHHCCHGHHGE